MHLYEHSYHIVITPPQSVQVYNLFLTMTSESNSFSHLRDHLDINVGCLGNFLLCIWDWERLTVFDGYTVSAQQWHEWWSADNTGNFWFFQLIFKNKLTDWCSFRSVKRNTNKKKKILFSWNGNRKMGSFTIFLNWFPIKNRTAVTYTDHFPWSLIFDILSLIIDSDWTKLILLFWLKVISTALHLSQFWILSYFWTPFRDDNKTLFSMC